MMNGREWSININKTSDERTVLLESGQSLYQHKQMTKDVGRPSERMVRMAFMHITKYNQAIVQAKIIKKEHFRRSNAPVTCR